VYTLYLRVNWWEEKKGKTKTETVGGSGKRPTGNEG
jgi:hypothetical protein